MMCDVIPWSNGFRHRGQKYSLLSMLDAVSKLSFSIAACLFTAIEDGQDCKASGRRVGGRIEGRRKRTRSALLIS
jgi:hypothetical protein